MAPLQSARGMSGDLRAARRQTSRPGGSKATLTSSSLRRSSISARCRSASSSPTVSGCSVTQREAARPQPARAHDVDLGGQQRDRGGEVDPRQQPDHDREDAVRAGRVPQLAIDDVPARGLHAAPTRPPPRARPAARRATDGLWLVSTRKTAEEDDDVDRERDDERGRAYCRARTSRTRSPSRARCPASMIPPITAIHPSARTRARTAFARRCIGTPQTWSSACSSASATLVPAHTATPMPDRQRRCAAVQRVDVVAQLRPDHREVGERRVEHPVLQAGVALERVAEQRHEHEQQREDREERVVGHARGQVATLVVGELLAHREREAEHGVPLLHAVEAVHAALEETHRAVMPDPRDFHPWRPRGRDVCCALTRREAEWSSRAHASAAARSRA